MSAAQLLAFVACFRDENPYLREWLEYHLLVGVGHFYLYDHAGDPEARRLLEPYVREGRVTLHDWSRFPRPTWWGRYANHRAYAHCARTYGPRCAWLLKIDLDEFLFPSAGDDVRGPIERLDRGRVRGLRIPRVNFGWCGHRTRPPGLVIESYTRREARHSNHKDLANAADLSGNWTCNSAHWWRYRPRTWLKAYVREERVEGLRINHYYTKSLEEYLRRQNHSRSRVLTEESFLQRNAGRDEVEDGSILRFVPAVRRALSARGE